MVFLLLVACSSQDSTGDKFFSSDGRYTPPGWGDADTGDTAGSDSGDTGANEGDPGAPIFSDITGEWTVYPDVEGDVLAVKASYTDQDDDLEGGQCFIDAYVDDANVGTFDGTASSDAGSTCVLSSGSMRFALQKLDTSQTTVVEFSAKDKSGNTSALYSVEVAGE